MRLPIEAPRKVGQRDLIGAARIIARIDARKPV